MAPDLRTKDEQKKKASYDKALKDVGGAEDDHRQLLRLIIALPLRIEFGANRHK